MSAITGDGRGGSGPGQTPLGPLGPLGELVEVFNERYCEALGSADALRVVEEVRDATLLKAMLNDEDFRERAGDLIMGSIWEEHRGERAE